MHFGEQISENNAMPRTPTIVAGLHKVDLPEARQAIPALHAYLRECVLDGTLTPGTKLSQVALADQLGVSRTPLREVNRATAALRARPPGLLARDALARGGEPGADHGGTASGRARATAIGTRPDRRARQ
jgi:hypothetical protein